MGRPGYLQSSGLLVWKPKVSPGFRAGYFPVIPHESSEPISWSLCLLQRSNYCSGQLSRHIWCAWLRDSASWAPDLSKAFGTQPWTGQLWLGGPDSWAPPGWDPSGWLASANKHTACTPPLSSQSGLGVRGNLLTIWKSECDSHPLTLQPDQKTWGFLQPLHSINDHGQVLASNLIHLGQSVFLVKQEKNH